jgi:hypothetical protein
LTWMKLCHLEVKKLISLKTRMIAINVYSESQTCLLLKEYNLTWQINTQHPKSFFNLIFFSHSQLPLRPCMRISCVLEWVFGLLCCTLFPDPSNICWIVGSTLG